MNDQPKQIIITLPNYEYQQLGCEDFLNESPHSPEWIGDPEKWKIKDIQCSTNERGKTIITAFIENHEWQTPKLTSVTGKELYEAIKDCPELLIKVSPLFGLEGRARCPIEYRNGAVMAKAGHLILQSTVFMGCKQHNIAQFLEDIGYYKREDSSISSAGNILCSDKPLAITFYGESGIYPITEIRKKDKHILLIFNTDFPIE